MIHCQLCNKEFKQITTTHLKKDHQITLDEYKGRFPDALLQDESIIMSGEKNHFFGKKHSEELKEWQREHFKGKKNPEAGKKISDKWKDPESSYRKLMQSESYRNKMSQVAQDYWSSEKSDNHRKRNRDSLKKIRPTWEPKLAKIRESKEYRESRKENALRMWQNMSKEEKDARFDKQIKTLIKNGNACKRSSLEIKLYSMILESCPQAQHSVWIHKSKTGRDKSWNIDIYIPDIDTYVQFDGMYWHGLDRSIEVIANSNSSRDKIIHGKWIEDRAQDDWFKSQGKRLIRILESEFKNDQEACVSRIFNKNAN